MLIDGSINEILRLIKSNKVVSVSAPTGSGKSLALPKSIAEEIGVCMVAIPTRTAVRSLVSYQKSVSPNLFIGSAADEIIEYDTNSKLIYATGGHIKKKIISNIKDWTWCDVLMVDEAHTGTIDITLIISLWKYANSKGYNVPKLLIASATLTPLDIESVYFEVSIPKKYATEITYISSIQRENSTPGNISNILKLSAQFAQDYHKSSNNNNSHVLIFVAGKKEVEELTSYLNQFVNVFYPKILQAYGDMDSKEIDKIYQNFNTRKIIVATNIAETSITIENIGLVIDTLVERISGTSFTGGHRLETTYISKDSAIQRSGRTGRTGPGKCIRMLPAQDYDKLNQHRVPEIYRIPIYEIVMDLLSHNIPPTKLFKGWGLDSKIEESIKLLYELKFLDTGEKLKITDRGIYASIVPLSVRNAAFIYESQLRKYSVYQSIVIACIIDTYWPPYYYVPQNVPNIEEYREKYFGNYIGENDLVTAVNMWNDYLVNYNRLWITKNSLNNKQINELIKKINKVNKITSEFLKYKIEPEQISDLGPFVNVLVEIYHNNILVNRRDNVYVSYKVLGDSRLEYYVDKNGFNTYAKRYPKAILALVSTEFVSRSSDTVTKTQRRSVSFSINIEYDEKGQIITNIEPSSISKLNTLNLLLNKPIVKRQYLNDIEIVKINSELTDYDLEIFLTSELHKTDVNDFFIN